MRNWECGRRMAVVPGWRGLFALAAHPLPPPRGEGGFEGGGRKMRKCWNRRTLGAWNRGESEGGLAGKRLAGDIEIWI